MIEHQTALSIIDLKPAIQPKARSRIWLVLVSAIVGASLSFGVTTEVHRIHTTREHAAVLHRAHALRMWRSHLHHAPAGCTFVRN